MPSLHRIFRPGGTYFFTLVTHHRTPLLCTPEARNCLRNAIANCRDRWPFTLYAIVLQPDHLHTIWMLPPGDSAYSRRIAFLKRQFTCEWLGRGHAQNSVTEAQSRQRRRGVFQPRFCEHTIRDESDLECRLNYIHFNPVKHGYCKRARDWPYSSFHRFVRDGVYAIDWGCSEATVTSEQWHTVAETAGE